MAECRSRKAAFYWHFALQTGALVLVWVGLGAIVINKVKQGYLSMYSVHAWCGVIVLFFFTAQVGTGPLLARSHLSRTFMHRREWLH